MSFMYQKTGQRASVFGDEGGRRQETQKYLLGGNRVAAFGE